MWSARFRYDVQEMLRAGLSDRDIARGTGVPRSTVGTWRRKGQANRVLRPPECWRPADPVSYCYLLGVYLGDGHISWRRNSGFIGITLDALYPELVGSVQSALAETFPDARVRTYPHPTIRRVNVALSSPLLLAAFPQHGPGKKHLRRIELVSWQLELTRAYPEHLVRGLIHSDGCRTVNRFATGLPSGRTAIYAYPRYFFSNLSADIRGIFCDHCDLLGVRWTESNPRNISISRRDSVALLDTFVGPKR